jgi:hypothetical protein
MIFYEKFVKREVKCAKLETADCRRDCSSSDDDLGSGFELYFNIYWVRTSRLDIKSQSEGKVETYDVETVLGNICVTIPLVIFKGSVLCLEVNSVCSD